MNIVKADLAKPILLGRQGEHGVTQIVFDLSGYIKKYGDGVASLIVKRPGDPLEYPVLPTRAEDTAVWEIGLEWTEFAGQGWCQLNWHVDNDLAKPEVYKTLVMEGKGAGEAPEPQRGYLDEVLATGMKAEKAAETAEQFAGVVTATAKRFDESFSGVVQAAERNAQASAEAAAASERGAAEHRAAAERAAAFAEHTVRYTEQTLTSEQKAQARENIEAASAVELSEAIEEQNATNVEVREDLDRVAESVAETVEAIGKQNAINEELHYKLNQANDTANYASDNIKRTADYIVGWGTIEQGTHITWRKWNSGIAEMWFRRIHRGALPEMTSLPAVAAVLGVSAYGVDFGGTTLPFAFVDFPRVTTNLSTNVSGTVLLAASGGLVSYQNAPGVRIIALEPFGADAKFFVDYYLMGRYSNTEMYEEAEVSG